MTPPYGSGVPPAKRRKLDAHVREAAGANTTSVSLKKAVSPPTSRRSTPVPAAHPLHALIPTWSFDDVSTPTTTPSPSQKPPRFGQINPDATSPATLEQNGKHAIKRTEDVMAYVASPFQLTKVRDLSPDHNADAVELKDILGSPLIKECWNFNFLFDVDFVMQQFDEDVRDLVKVKIVHGFWKRDDERRIDLLEAAERYTNVDLISAYLPDPFGTHHSKMLILFRHDDCAQVVIHTANMIAKDWTNMTQAVWQSPLLPLKSDLSRTGGSHPIGSGERFYLDLRRYLLSYESRLKRMVDQLALHDFSKIRAAFLGSAPSRLALNKADPSLQTSLGWLGLQEILDSVPSATPGDNMKPPHIVLQVSSIATLGAAPTWLSHFQSVLARSKTRQSIKQARPKFNIIFPTAEEVRTSLDGYESGGSIHMRVQSAQQQKQLEYLHPLLCHWKHSLPPASAALVAPTNEAHRGPAAPHIKTYIRFSNDSHSSIEWALLTSANLSKQAWGDVVNKQGEVRIQSYETGVLVWPHLFAPANNEVRMVPTFGKDTPDLEDAPAEPHEPDSNAAERDEEDVETEDEETEDEETEDESEQAQPLRTEHGTTIDKGKAPVRVLDKKRVVVGLRMPYDLPLSPYSAQDVPWCATQQYTEPDWKGRAWGGY